MALENGDENAQILENFENVTRDVDGYSCISDDDDWVFDISGNSNEI